MEQRYDFEVRRTELSRPTHPMRLGYLGLAVFFTIFAVVFFCAKIITFGAICAGIAAVFIAELITFARKTSTQQGACPYCCRQIIMLTSETRFDCPLCSKTIEKTSHDLINVEPLPEQLAIAREEINARLAQMIADDFIKIGWTKWKPEIHKSAEQLRRLERATSEFCIMHIVQYNELRGIAKIKGTQGQYYLTSGERCSCPDYRTRKQPCKHMYLFATELADKGVTPEQDFSPSVSGADDNVLGGLCFAITGQNQAPVREFLKKHGGMFCESVTDTISALVLSTDTQTEKRDLAEIRDIEILSFEQLQNLFDIYHN